MRRVCRSSCSRSRRIPAAAVFSIGHSAILPAPAGCRQQPSEEGVETARELVRQARVALTGPDGLLKESTKAVFETVLDEKMPVYLGCHKHVPVVVTGQRQERRAVGGIVIVVGRFSPGGGSADDRHMAQNRQRSTPWLCRRSSPQRLRPGTSWVAECALLEVFIAAWHRRDIPALVSLLATDALLTMPLEPLAYRGGEAIASFLSTVPAGGDLTATRLVPTRANGQPAVAAYLRGGPRPSVTGSWC